jgi:sugar/nucleoside kinase (ribokinase family)
LLHSFLKEIITFLKSEIGELNVVVMPDFFLDRLISLNYDVKDFSKILENVARRKGGSIDKIEQMELRGGNAINTASALATLGAKVTPIICTSKFGLQVIKFYLKPLVADFSHIKILEKSSITTAMELATKNGKVNIMLRDVGALADFGPHDLNDDDFEAIKNANYVCVFNWAGTRRFGTELAKTVFHHAKTMGKGKTYYDTADPIPNKKNIPKLVKNVLRGKDIDVLSVNENEAICYASQLDNEILELAKKMKSEELANESVRILTSQISARVDLHTTSFSATFTKKGKTAVPVFKAPVLRATGSGDAWNAGNVLGDASRLSDGGRLALANAVAAYYISNSNGLHPTRKQLIKFCEKTKLKTA